MIIKKSCPWFLALIAMAPPVATAISALVMKEGVTCGGMSPMAMRHWWCWLGKLVEAWATRCDWPGAKVMGRSVYAQQAASSHPRATHHCATKVPNAKRFWTARVMLCTVLNNYMWSAFHHLCYPEDSRRSWGSLPWERQEPGEPSSQIVACCLTTTWPATVCLQWSAHSQMLPFIATSLAANFAALLQSGAVAVGCIALHWRGQRRSAGLDFSGGQLHSPFISDYCWPGWQCKQLVLSLSAAQFSQHDLAHKLNALVSLQIDSIQFWRRPSFAPCTIQLKDSSVLLI